MRTKRLAAPFSIELLHAGLLDATAEPGVGIRAIHLAPGNFTGYGDLLTRLPRFIDPARPPLVGRYAALEFCTIPVLEDPEMADDAIGFDTYYEPQEA